MGAPVLRAPGPYPHYVFRSISHHLSHTHFFLLPRTLPFYLALPLSSYPALPFLPRTFPSYLALPLLPRTHPHPCCLLSPSTTSFVVLRYVVVSATALRRPVRLSRRPVDVFAVHPMTPAIYPLCILLVVAIVYVHTRRQVYCNDHNAFTKSFV